MATATWLNPFTDLSQCTAWVADQAHALSGWNIPNWGDAGNWSSNAAAQHYQVDNKPVAGTIAVWAPGKRGSRGSASSVGHVAFVTGVSGNNIQITERNWPEGSGPHSSWIPASDVSSFIHPFVQTGTVTSYPASQAINNALGGVPAATAGTVDTVAKAFTSVPDALNWVRDHLWHVAFLMAGSVLIVGGAAMYRSETKVGAI